MVLGFLGGLSHLTQWQMNSSYTVADEHLLSAIWDTSHWKFVKFGFKTV